MDDALENDEVLTLPISDMTLLLLHSPRRGAVALA